LKILAPRLASKATDLLSLGGIYLTGGVMNKMHDLIVQD